MWNIQGVEALGFKIFNLIYRRSMMTETNTSENVRLDMPGTKTSGDPETTKNIPVVTEDQQTKKTGKKKPPPKK
jgi:hypothetical protein